VSAACLLFGYTLGMCLSWQVALVMTVMLPILAVGVMVMGQAWSWKRRRLTAKRQLWLRKCYMHFALLSPVALNTGNLIGMKVLFRSCARAA